MVISIHALRMERDHPTCRRRTAMTHISIHALRMERDPVHERLHDRRKDFYPRAPHGARRGGTFAHKDIAFISIHALRMERDTLAEVKSDVKELFLSTRSAWSATYRADAV